MLCYWAWLKQDTYWSPNAHQKRRDAERAIDIMITELVTLWPRTDGNGWNLTKLHEQRHVPQDIERFGRHRNVHTGPQEHNHIALVKKPALNTQKRAEQLDTQMAERLFDRLLIAQATTRILTNQTLFDEHVTQEKRPPIFNMGSKGTFRIIRLLGNRYQVLHDWDNQCFDGTKMKFITHIKQLMIVSVQQMLPRLEGADNALNIRFFTEYKRNTSIFRAHPNYRGLGPWYDWAKVLWENEEHEGTSLIIGRILLFVELNEEMFAVVHSVKATSFQQYGVFINLWTMENNRQGNPVLHLATVDSLERLVLMVPYDTSGNRWIEVEPKNQWANCFATV